MYNNYGFPYSMPTATQPYGVPMFPQAPTAPQPTPQPVQQQPQSNIVYVNGIDDVKNRPLPPNSNYAFMDNDNPILYRKTVDAQGRMAVEVFDIVPHKEAPVEKVEYATKKDIELLQAEIAKLHMEAKKND